MIGMIRWAFIAFLIVLGLGLTYLSAYTMKTKMAWTQKLKQYEANLQKAQDDLLALQQGTPDNRLRIYSPTDPELNPVAPDKAPEIGLRLVTDAASWWVRQRGRRWVGNTTKLDPATGAATIAITEPTPHDISATVAEKEVISYQYLYAFDGREGGTAGYLGEFRVTAVAKDGANNSIDVVPNDTLTPQELDKLVKNSGANAAWFLFERLPTDHHVTFANSPDAINTLLPPSVRQEYLDHGRDALETDKAENLLEVGGKKVYFRPLYDFMAIFRDLRARRPVISDKVLARTNDAEAMKAALKALVDPPPPEPAVSGRIVDRMKEIAALEKELADAQLDAKNVADAVALLQEEVAKSREALDKVFNENRQLAAEIVKQQQQAMSRITSATALTK